ncbi:MAG: hypothetical protein A3F14_05570 [Gammaproteobacteria bacterium RIFCSPHIGHO2_12_FULL_43_28]|nr:MAG: hypothetical protein A3F14_05570 [Gammaproteobacteria bacterium RIFCSPHIGHO2_12_FULL_43_28]
MYEHRDTKIIKFINEFGFCEIPQIEKQFGLNKARAYKIMQRLVKRGYVIHERIFYHRHGIYRVTRQGAQISGLPRLDKVPVGIYEHQIAVIEIYIKLMREYPDAHWMSERAMRKTGSMPRVGRNRDRHYADALFFLPDGKQIAIEVELTMKSKNRLDDILSDYVCQFEINEVWYFCAPDVFEKVKKLAAKFRMIKVFKIPSDTTDNNTSDSSVG